MTTTPKRIQRVEFWANRFGDYGGPKHPAMPAMTEDDTRRIDQFYPTNENYFCECAHVVVCDGKPGMLIEWEYDNHQRPDPVRAAHWRLLAPEGCVFDAYECDENRPTYEACWVLVAFIEADYLSEELVTRVTKLMEAHI